jgi:hypothetical protein
MRPGHPSVPGAGQGEDTGMIALDGRAVTWLCDSCHFRFSSPGIPVHGQPNTRGHYPQVRRCCSEACAVVAESQLGFGARRLEWAHVIEALGLKEARACG